MGWPQSQQGCLVWAAWLRAFCWVRRYSALERMVRMLVARVVVGVVGLGWVSGVSS